MRTRVIAAVAVAVSLPAMLALFEAVAFFVRNRPNGSIVSSGQRPINAQNNHLELGDIHSETLRVLLNVQAILEVAGSSLADTVRMGVFLADLNDFEAMNEVFREFFPENPPARTTIGCNLPQIKVEIDCIARLR